MTDPSKSTKMKGQPGVGFDPAASVVRQIRVRTEDSAFVYAIFEASEGVCGYSTLPHKTGDRHRDLQLVIPVGQQSEVDRILKDLADQFPGEIYELKVDPV